VGESRSVCEVEDVFGRPEKRPTLVFLVCLLLLLLPLLLFVLAFLLRSPRAGELEAPDPEPADLEFLDGLFRSSWVLEPFLRPNSFEKKPMLTVDYSTDFETTATSKVEGRMVYARYVAKLLTKDDSVVSSSGVGGTKKLLLDGVASLIDCTRLVYCIGLVSAS
jgi:hypothetical protein